MHTVELLEHAITAARTLGFKIRQEWLGGSGGGGCCIRGEQWIFVDLAQNPPDQLAHVLDAIRGHAAIDTVEMHPIVRRAIQRKQAA